MPRNTDSETAAQNLVNTAATAAGASLGTGPSATAATDQLGAASRDADRAGATGEQVAQAFANWNPNSN